ncbi:MAG: pyrimidine 5'-nucleotidase [Marivibrio sp.]|uniref:pyrimidine 5'-nucleotidase n=1 Tax=Marivibrio sp. TaxID=2039719 RepID=UPI0032EB5F3B
MTTPKTPASDPAPGSGAGSDLNHPRLLAQAQTWIFDLDNTLYPARCNLFDQVDQRMGRFIAEALSVDHDEARVIQKRYFRDYGTTLSGLMARHDVDPHDFLAYVHDIDYSPIEPDLRLADALDRLPGRKVIFTNGTVAHAQSVIDRLGVERHFAEIFDIHAADYTPKPKPAPYRTMVERFAVAPETAVMVEDIAQNLETPHAMGMRTVWVRTEHAWSKPGVGVADADAADEGAPAPYIHHVTEDLTTFLHEVLASDDADPSDPTDAPARP